ncbi:hypothetical protein EDB87DRAFT_414563 [Lactarius vividus]|nr:hypothetical protein EDB87DRAFT_414563 [Lactarius vividus]
MQAHSTPATHRASSKDLSFPLTYLSSPGRPPWIAITYVCGYWRSAALGLLELWSSITPDLSASWSRAMMERSTPLLMRIDISIGASCRDGLGLLAASELLTTTSRIRTLRLSGSPNDIINVLGRLRSPSPLESLSLRLIAHNGQSVNLPKAFFWPKGSEPSLPHIRKLHRMHQRTRPAHALHDQRKHRSIRAAH